MGKGPAHDVLQVLHLLRWSTHTQSLHGFFQRDFCECLFAEIGSLFSSESTPSYRYHSPGQEFFWKLHMFKRFSQAMKTSREV